MQGPDNFFIDNHGTDDSFNNFLESSNLSEGDSEFTFSKGNFVKKSDSSNALKLRNELNSMNNFVPDSYIIEFKNPPLIKKQKVYDDSIRNLEIQKQDFISKGEREVALSINSQIEKKETEKLTDILNYKKELGKEHNLALLDIESRISGQLATVSLWGGVIDFFKKLSFKLGLTGFSVSDTQIKPEKEFYGVFNGVVLSVSQDEAEKIKKSKYVKNVYPNLIVETNLYDSVPLINADKLWQMKDSLGNNINGTNMRIGIIDTGIDYTHPDLGGCNLFQINSSYCFKKSVVIINKSNNLSCIDYDGGINICQKSLTEIIKDYEVQNFESDVCDSKFRVKEKSCSSEGNILTSIIDCPEGSSCVGGVCTMNNVDLKLCSKVIGGYDFVNNDNNPIDDHGHGTNVAGIAAGAGDSYTEETPETPSVDTNIYESVQITSDARKIIIATFNPYIAHSKNSFSFGFAHDDDTNSTTITPRLSDVSNKTIHVIE